MGSIGKYRYKIPKLCDMLADFVTSSLRDIQPGADAN